jgi:hypothetical protein
MKVHPITFTAAEIRAILDGRKTQFRRVIKLRDGSNPDEGDIDLDRHGAVEIMDFSRSYPYWESLTCPYGQPGDRLWVRELWSPYGTKSIYRADTKPSITEMLKRAGHTGIGSWTPAVQMPRKHSRILLENESVRVERLQEISRSDAKAEGFWPGSNGLESWDGQLYGNAELAFRACWESINGPGSWAANPWVWVVEFRVVEGGTND